MVHSFFVSYQMVVESEQSRPLVHQEVPVSGKSPHFISKESEMQQSRRLHHMLQDVPRLREIIIMEVQELQCLHLHKHVG